MGREEDKIPTYDRYHKFHFRHHNKKVHPVLVVGENKEKYKYIPTTSSPKRDKHHENEEFVYHPKTGVEQIKIKNPNERSHMEKRIKSDYKKNMPTVKKKWKLSKLDYKKVIKLINGKKK